MSDKETRTRKVIAELLGVEESQVTDDKQLVLDLGADSIDEVELVMSIEDEFGVMIPDEDADKCKTVRDVLDLVGRIVPGN